MNHSNKALANLLERATSTQRTVINYDGTKGVATLADRDGKLRSFHHVGGFWDEVQGMAKLFKITEPGQREPAHGLAEIPADHAQLLMVEAYLNDGVPINGLTIGEKTTARFRSSDGTAIYDIVRVK